MTVPASAPLCIVPAHLRSQEDADHLLRCVLSLAATAPEAEIMVVDDGTIDDDIRTGVRLACQELGILFYALPGHPGFAAAANIGIQRALASGSEAVLVRSDTVVAPGWLPALLARTDTQGRPAAIVSVRVLSDRGRVRNAGYLFSNLTRRWAPRFEHAPGELPGALLPVCCPVSSALMLIRHATLERLGPLDEGMKAGLEDVDICLRAFLAGEEAIYEPAVAVTRLGVDDRNRAKRLREWAKGSELWMSRKWAAADLSPFVLEAL
jgi:N-acetylglucosaminyl-diphospho-decaprenol L-rhamnosyltransferase